MRVCGLDTPYPLALEKEYVPDALKVMAAIKQSMDF
jgi:2-oxoisovalerate dehydrogenase E1 component beta subunit